VFLEMATKKVNKTNKKSTKRIPHLYKEHNPECHKMTGKFVVLYILFAFTTVAFAALAVWLFIFGTDMLNKYEAIDPACRNGNCQQISPDNGADEE